jgi:hypothetical protein
VTLNIGECLLGNTPHLTLLKDGQASRLLCLDVYLQSASLCDSLGILLKHLTQAAFV